MLAVNHPPSKLACVLVQVAEWGHVEAGHDLDEVDIATRIASPAIMLALLRCTGP